MTLSPIRYTKSTPLEIMGENSLLQLYCERNLKKLSTEYNLSIVFSSSRYKTEEVKEEFLKYSKELFSSIFPNKDSARIFEINGWTHISIIVTETQGENEFNEKLTRLNDYLLELNKTMKDRFHINSLNLDSLIEKMGVESERKILDEEISYLTR